MNCTALTARGVQCRNRAVAGGDRCRVHRRDDVEGLEELALATVVQAALESWTAAAWLLERRFPERWARAARGKPVEEPPAGLDALDELAGKRASRRARSIGD